MSKYIKLYGTSIPVKGYFRSIMCDLQTRQYEFIPNSLCDIFLRHENLSIIEFYGNVEKSEKEILNEYLDFLLEHDFVFYTDSSELFPKMNTYWENSSVITNSIIEVDAKSQLEQIFNFISQLNLLSCWAVQIRILNKLNINKIRQILDKFNGSEVNSIEIILMQSDIFQIEYIENLIRIYRRITAVYIFNAIKVSVKQHYNVNIVFSNLNFSCGSIQPFTCGINISTYVEGLNRNLCLNCKICLDKFGYIKNCPNMEHNFGNIDKYKLLEIINSSDFQSLWRITKDQIEVCKDCEFRYICTDCRCFIKDPNNLYSQPAKCGYNPYIAKWKDQDGYVPVEECGKYSKENGFVPDKEKIERMNNEIWK